MATILTSGRGSSSTACPLVRMELLSSREACLQVKQLDSNNFQIVSLSKAQVVWRRTVMQGNMPSLPHLH